VYACRARAARLATGALQFGMSRQNVRAHLFLLCVYRPIVGIASAFISQLLNSPATIFLYLLIPSLLLNTD
jgi:hypothetical protein